MRAGITVSPSCLAKALIVYSNEVSLLFVSMAARLDSSPTWYPKERFAAVCFIGRKNSTEDIQRFAWMRLLVLPLEPHGRCTPSAQTCLESRDAEGVQGTEPECMERSEWGEMLQP